MTKEEVQIIIGNMPIKPEVLDDCYDVTEYQAAKAMAIKALDQRWIPVSEELPEANRAVLTYIDIGATKTYCLAYWNDAYKAWEEWMGYRLIEKDRDYKVIAWMSLPEPYKEDEEDDE